MQILGGMSVCNILFAYIYKFHFLLLDILFGIRKKCKSNSYVIMLYNVSYVTLYQFFVK